MPIGDDGELLDPVPLEKPKRKPPTRVQRGLRTILIVLAIALPSLILGLGLTYAVVHSNVLSTQIPSATLVLPTMTVDPLQYNVSALAWSPDSQLLAVGMGAGFDSGRTQIRRAVDKSLIVVVGKAITSRLQSVAWSPDGTMLASTKYGAVELWDTRSWKLIRTLPDDKGLIFTVAWSPDSKLLATGGAGDNNVRIWDATTGQMLHVLSGHTMTVRQVAWSPDGKTLASVSLDETIRLWDGQSGNPLQTLRNRTQYGATVYNIAWSPDSKMLAVGGADNMIRLWDVHDPSNQANMVQPMRLINVAKGPVYAVAWSPDGQTLASGNNVERVRLTDITSGKLVEILDEPAMQFNPLAWAPNGRTLAYITMQGNLRLSALSSILVTPTSLVTAPG